MRNMENPGALAGATGAGELPSQAAGQARNVAHAKVRRIIIRSLGRGEWAAETETGEVLVARSRTPFLDGARALLALGADPVEPVTMAHAKRPDLDCFRPVALGVAARLSVEEGERSARFRKWRNPAERLRPVGAEGDLSAFPPSDALRPSSEREGLK